MLHQLLIEILAPVSTLDLLPLTLVCRRFHELVVRILHQRLLRAAELPDNELILECYHPSARLNTPSLGCRYLSTEAWASNDSDEVDLAGLSALYSRFRPVPSQESRLRRSRRNRPTVESFEAPEDVDDEVASVDVTLDESELFSQLVTSTSIVKVGPARSVFLSLVNIDDGVLRVWRAWLAVAATAAGSSGEISGYDDPSILWTDSSKTVGLRFDVESLGSDRMPLIIGLGEDPPISYTLTYRGRHSSGPPGFPHTSPTRS